MWKSKKFMLITFLVVLLVGGTFGGVAIAQANDQENGQNQTGKTAFLEKVAEIYEDNTGDPINADELQQAFIEAGQALKDEAFDNYLQKLVDEEKITQNQADEYKAWLNDRPALMTDEFKEWMESRPAFLSDEFKEWMESRPDIPGLFGNGNGQSIKPFDGMQRGSGKFGEGFKGMFGGRFGGGWCAPDAPDNETD
jgi:hypothetical protein